MKKKAFRKDGLLAKATAAVLSVTLALCMTPAMALAQPAEAPAKENHQGLHLRFAHQQVRAG